MKPIPSRHSSPLPPRPIRALDPGALDAVRGGVSHSIISPRDAASSLPTG
jgi:hypothetical protein